MNLKDLPLSIRLPYKEGKSGYWHKCGMWIYTLEEWASHTCEYKKLKTDMGKNKNIAQKLGRRGGKTTKAKFGIKFFKRISKLGVKARQK